MEQAATKKHLFLARIRAKKDGDMVVVYLSDRRKIALEKSALTPAGARNIRWEWARVNECGVAIIPAHPKEIRFIAQDVLVLSDPEFAETYIKQRFENAAGWASVLKKFRLRCKLSMGEAAKLSGVDGFTIARMEAGYPVFPPTTFFKVLHTFVRFSWGEKGQA